MTQREAGWNNSKRNLNFGLSLDTQSSINQAQTTLMDWRLEMLGLSS